MCYVVIFANAAMMCLILMTRVAGWVSDILAICAIAECLLTFSPAWRTSVALQVIQLFQGFRSYSGLYLLPSTEEEVVNKDIPSVNLGIFIKHVFCAESCAFSPVNMFRAAFKAPRWFSTGSGENVTETFSLYGIPIF
jgi:hypothetical protein